MNRTAALALSTVLLTTGLTGCNAGAPNAAADGSLTVRQVRASKPAAAKVQAPAAAAAKAAPEIVATATLAITGSAGYRLQTLTAYNTTDIDHVTLTLFKNDGTGTYVSTGVTKNVANAALATAIALGNLRSAATYRVVARAYADSAEVTEIDDIAESGATTNCAVDFTTPTVVSAAAGDNIDDASMVVTIPLKLKSKTFAGTASAAAGVSVTNGVINDTTSTETLN